MEFKLGKNPCPHCTSSDGFHFYGDGNGGFCFVCNYTVLSDEKKAELGVEDIDIEEIMSREPLTKEQIDVIIDLYNHGNSYHEISVAMDELFGVKISDDAIRKRIKRKTEPTKKKKKLSRCLVLSDLHVPYNRNDIIDIVKEQAGRIDTLILGGDIVDCESISEKMQVSL